MIWMILGAVLVLAGAGCFFLWFEDNALQLTRYSVRAEVKNSMKLVQLSDLHDKQFGKDNRRLYRMVASCRPDLIVFTGDLVHDAKNIFPAIEFLGRLTKLAPVVYIPGNHEHRSGLYSEILAGLKGQGVQVLADTLTSIQVCGNPVHILGLDENQGSYETYDLRKQGKYRYRSYDALFRVFEQKEGFRLVLSHYPENFAAIGELSYQQYDFDLMLSGHAHGGQFRLPLFGAVFAPGQGIRPSYTEGRHGERPALIISRGLGNSSFPFRVFNRPEVVEITVRPGKNAVRTS